MNSRTIQAYRTRAVVSEDGKVTLKELPFQPGEVVEIIVLASDRKRNKADYPLRGTVLKYESPTDPVAQDDWDALNKPEQ